ncbi:MAG: EamA family transporter [Paracoccaceae bacterium]
MTLGPRYITSSEVSLLVLLESVLAPLLVWAVIGEHPGRYSLLGGFIVIAALLASNIWALRRASAI